MNNTFASHNMSTTLKLFDIVQSLIIHWFFEAKVIWLTANTDWRRMLKLYSRGSCVTHITQNEQK